MRAVFAFGRMNPPTTGHRRVVERLQQEAKTTGVKARLYLSNSHDPKRNPLTPQQKLSFAQQMFPEVEVRLAQTLFDAANNVADDGFDDVLVIVGEDRLDSFSKSLSAYVGTDKLGLQHVEVQALSRSAEDASATQARTAALEGDWQAFQDLTPTDDETLARSLYEAVRFGLGV